jgi:DNA helicase II / ATP-dependent DNA helicase PcrA
MAAGRATCDEPSYRGGSRHMTSLIPTSADRTILKCLIERRSFSVVAGAGSGKTTSLVEALKSLIKTEGARMLRDGQRAVCITYTNRAVGVINNRLRQNPLFAVSTLHSFLWGELRHFPTSIRESLRRSVLPTHVAKQKAKDNGGKSKEATEARQKAAKLQEALAGLDSVEHFRYGDDTPFSNYLQGEIGHDDLVMLAADLIKTSCPLRRILGQRYPYIFVDEAQDASPDIVSALNVLCDGEGLPLVGYFGDPMQQIYDEGMGDFAGPPGSEVIKKEENFRSAPEVISFLNAFRNDVTQAPSERNSAFKGTVGITLVQAETPEAPRRRYSDEQLERAQQRLAQAIELWGWTERKGAKQLFLARRMIARRLGFLPLHDLFDGPYASGRAKRAYEKGEHYLLKPFLQTIIPLVKAHREGNGGAAMRVLTTNAVAFLTDGAHARKTVRDVREIAKEVTDNVARLFASSKVGDVLRYSREQGLVHASEPLSRHLDRSPRHDEFDESKHEQEKGDWLADALLQMDGALIEKYRGFLDENTPYSTQHGVKGEQYEDVIVVFDDVEAAWSEYTFAKMLTPLTVGAAKQSQKERSRKLAYVCFSRAVLNLRVLLFTIDPASSARELSERGFFKESQIRILG